MFKFIKLASVVLLGFRESLATKCIPLTNQIFIIRRILIDLNIDEHNHGLHPYSYLGSLDKFARSYETIDNPSRRICVPIKTEAVNLNIFHGIIWKTESKSLMLSILERVCLES